MVFFVMATYTRQKKEENERKFLHIVSHLYFKTIAKKTSRGAWSGSLTTTKGGLPPKVTDSNPLASNSWGQSIRALLRLELDPSRR